MAKLSGSPVVCSGRTVSPLAGHLSQSNPVWRLVVCSVHRIRLRGPWQCEWYPEQSTAATEGEQSCAAALVGQGGAAGGQRQGRTDVPGGTARSPEVMTVRLPANWRSLFGDVAGRARFVRRFNRPSNLGSREKVFLAIEQVGGSGAVFLNGQLLGSLAGPTSSIRFDVSSKLQPSNTLVIELSYDPQSSPDVVGGLPSPVTIEIESG